MDFESKINRLISCVAAKMGIDIGDRLNVNAKKVKFAVTGPLPKDSAFPNFRDFEVREKKIYSSSIPHRFQVVHHYLQTASRTMQSRLRKRGRQGKYSYIHTIRKQVMIINHSFFSSFCSSHQTTRLFLRWEVK